MNQTAYLPFGLASVRRADADEFAQDDIFSALQLPLKLNLSFYHRREESVSRPGLHQRSTTIHSSFGGEEMGESEVEE